MFDKTLMELPGMRGVLALLLVSSLGQAALVIGQTLLLATALSNLWAGSSLQSQLALFAGFIGCFAGRRIVILAQEEFVDSYARRQTDKLRSQVLATTFDGDASQAHRAGTAATALAATDNLDDVSRYLRVVPPKIIGLACITMPVLVALFSLDWVSGIIALVSFPIIIFFMVLLGRQAQTRAERQFEESTRLSNHFIDTLRGLDSIRALNAEDKAAASVYEASEQMRAATVRTLSVATLSSAVLDLISVFGIAAIAMMLAFRLMDGSVTLFVALSALMLAPEYFAPIRAFAGDFHASLDGRTALAAVLSIIKQGDAVEQVIVQPDDAPSHQVGESGLSARGIGFSYDDGTIALHDVSFSLEGNMKVGIVGASGAGKSTLADLLAGFKLPCEGSFVVDGKTIDLRSGSWRNRVHYIPQHPHLFRMTLEDNIKLYTPTASRADVERAVLLSGLGPLVGDLPEGLNTVIGEAGRGLSGGEAQRIALARILIGSRDVLVFDEPTAHLDIETELELKQKMLPCMEGKLVFFATHRLHWLANMDYVIVLQNGTISEMGTPAELLARNGALRKLADESLGVAS